MNAKIIKTELEYQQTLVRFSALMDAEVGSLAGEELELLSLLLEKYEEEHFPIDLPDPIEAIKFRMQQQGLTRKDLEPYIGSQSKVSEVLNKKRPLSLAMMRALHSGLGIPAEVLLQEPGRQLAPPLFAVDEVLFAEMFHAGYFPHFKGTLRQAREIAEELLAALFAPLQAKSGQKTNGRQSPLAREHSSRRRVAESRTGYSTAENITPSGPASNSKEPAVDEMALNAWQARVLTLAIEKEPHLPPYAHKKITPDFIREVVKLSALAKGPLLAQELLAQRGIPLVVLPHLAHTYLDGACFRTPGGRAVVGLTLRHDRLDNFWFTLTHELAHVHLHLEQDLAFFDETESGMEPTYDPYETQANALAWDLLIPPQDWSREKQSLLAAPTEARILEFSEKVFVSPAIIAGRIRWETGDTTRFVSLVGSKTVKKLFVTAH